MRTCLSIGYLGTDGLAREEQPEPILEKFDLPQPDVPVPQSRGEDDLVTPSRVRQFFPETWLWSEHMLGEDESSVVEKVIVPDTITSWVADAFAVSATQAMTIAHPTTLTVFQPFFVTINLPYSVIRGELVEITVTVFNYLQDETTAYVDLNVNEDEMRVAIGKQNRKQLQSGSRPLEVPPGEGKATTYYLLPLRNGYVPIQATVRSQTAADSVIRHLLVEPEGVKEEYSQSALMCVEAFPGDMCVNRQFNVSLPLKLGTMSEQTVRFESVNFPNHFLMVRNDGSVDCVENQTNNKAKFRVEHDLDSNSVNFVRLRNVKFLNFITISNNSGELLVTTTSVSDFYIALLYYSS
jgi:hypothetical protein